MIKNTILLWEAMVENNVLSWEIAIENEELSRKVVVGNNLLSTNNSLKKKKTLSKIMYYRWRCNKKIIKLTSP